MLTVAFSPPTTFPQLFDDNKFEAAEPDIATDVKYNENQIIFKFEMDKDYHITDLKYGFFAITVESNTFIDISKVTFPKGTHYEEELVFKGKFDVAVSIKAKKKIEAPVKLKFIVSYQMCRERPQSVCFPPAEKTVEVVVDKSFKTIREIPGIGVGSAAQANTAGEGTKPVETVSNEEKSSSMEALEDLSAKTQREIVRSKGGNWLIIGLISIILLALSLFIGLSDFLRDDSIYIKFIKAGVFAVLFAGVFLFFKALDIKYFPGSYSQQKPKDTVSLKWLKSIDEGKAAALESNKPIMIDTAAEWCVACRELDEYTFSDAEVAKNLEAYVLVRLDFTKKNAENDALRKTLGVMGLPTVIFMDSKGTELKRFSGFLPKDRFLSFLGEKPGGMLDGLVKLLKGELEKKSILLFGLVFLLGFLTSLTPCVYPVIPIVMGYIGTRSGQKKLKGLYLSIFFVLGLAVVYSILGVVAAMSGSMMGISFQSPAVVIIIAAIFVLMGLSMAGLFEIPVPTSISSKIQTGNKKSEVIASVLVGGVSGIIAAPCVGPVLIALLSWVSQSRNIFLGFLLTFIFSLGMGVIFLLVGTFSGVVSALPKGGKWMDYIKYFFAALLIAGGIYILNAIIPSWINLLLWGTFLLSLGVFTGLFTSHEHYSLKTKIYKFIVLMVFLVGIFLFFKALDLKFFTAAVL